MPWVQPATSTYYCKGGILFVPCFSYGFIDLRPTIMQVSCLLHPIYPLYFTAFYPYDRYVGLYMLQVVWGEHKLQEGCVMALMVSEGNEESLAGFWLSKASKVSWFTGFRKFPEIKIVFLHKIKAINKISKFLACFQWNVEFHHV